MAGAGPVLLADIGGTNARFGLLRGTDIDGIRALPAADYDSLAAAARAYLAGCGLPAGAVEAAAIAVAGPVGASGDDVEIAMTNRSWSFRPPALARALGIARLQVVNDFVAQALALPHLGPGDLSRIGGGAPAEDAPRAILGPGTGLGAAALIPVAGGWHPLATEGGHVTLAAATDEEEAVLRTLRHRIGHVSAERVLSGPGLEALYGALAEISGNGGRLPPKEITAEEIAAEEITAEEITAGALSGGDALAVRTVEMFCAFLGTFAADFALSTDARGGVHIAGGIVPRLGKLFAASGFRERFETKGRFGPYMRAIPTWVVTARFPAFHGLRALALAPPQAHSPQAQSPQT